MCDYVYTRKTPDQGITRVTESYCKRASQFWVQSTISTHNAHACPHHLARIVREIEEAARPFDILAPGITPEPDERYALTDGKSGPKRITPYAANGARVTVKLYNGK